MIVKVEAMETRDLLAGVGPVLPPSPIAIPPPAAALVQPPATPTDAPRVDYVQFEPLTGRVLVVYSGNLAGYSTATLTDPANYGFKVVKSFAGLPSEDPSRPKAGVVLAPTIRITGVTLSTPVAPGTQQSILVSINNNQPLRNGIYQFTIRSPGISDLAGRPLDGQYFGTFPSGDGQPGGDFVANLVQTHNTVLPAQRAARKPGQGLPPAIVPTYVYLPPTSAVQVRYAAAKPGKFMLAGGNNITLIPLAHQFFPGTFRLPMRRASLFQGGPAGKRA